MSDLSPHDLGFLTAWQSASRNKHLKTDNYGDAVLPCSDLALEVTWHHCSSILLMREALRSAYVQEKGTLLDERVTKSHYEKTT